MKTYKSFKRRQDDPFPQTNVGRACLYEEKANVVTRMVARGAIT